MRHSVVSDCWWLQFYWMQSIIKQACRYINQPLEGLLVMIRDRCFVWTLSNQRHRESEGETWKAAGSHWVVNLSFSFSSFFISTPVVCREIKESPQNGVSFFRHFSIITVVSFVYSQWLKDPCEPKKCNHKIINHVLKICGRLNCHSSRRCALFFCAVFMCF